MARSPDRNPIPARRAACGPPSSRSTGFTLLELLIVVCLLAIVAGGAVLLSGGVEDRAALDMARSELAELRKAVLAFRRDTGHLPKTGPFALVADGGAIDPSDDSHWPAGAPSGAAARAAWFASPANFYQLYERRDDLHIHAALATITGDAGVAFNVETGRGYRGPYLTAHGEGFVFVGADLAPDDSADPVPGVADPFRDRTADGALYTWSGSPLGGPDAATARTLGRPYLLFPEAPAGPGDLGPRIVCLGANGVYDSDASALNPSAGGDDLAVFLTE